jgi:nucleoside-diphosphate kinase
MRDMMGKTNGRDSAPGTIRGDFGLSRQMNLIHGSDSIESAAREIAIYFKPEELITSSSALEPWLYASDEVK